MRIGVLSFCLVLLMLMYTAAANGRTCGENEVYLDCGPSCEDCKTLYEPCLIRHIRCPDGCFCKDGYRRHTNGKCIPNDKCPRH